MNDNLQDHIAAVRRLLEKGSANNAGTLKDRDVEFIRDVGEWISDNRITVEQDTGTYFDLISKRYPIAVHRIAWVAVTQCYFLDARSHFGTGEVQCDELERAMREERNTIEGWFREQNISIDNEVVGFGDFHEVALRMTVAVLLECYPTLFVQDQHTYVMPCDGSWCLNGTIEGQIYFGRADDAIATGAVNLDSFCWIDRTNQRVDQRWAARRYQEPKPDGGH